MNKLNKMEFSNITTKGGLLQNVEFWISIGDGGITGDATLKAVFVNLINRRYERAMGMLGATSRLSGIDDTNYTNQPFSYFNISATQNDYQFLVDSLGNSITDITDVLILPSTTATDYVELEKLTLDNDEAELIMSPNSSNTGVPTGYIEANNTVFFNTIPNYTKANGGKLFYKRVPSYFVVGDTTKQPGFSAEHHQILSLGAAYDWIISHSPSNQILITRIEAELNRAEKEFKVYCAMRSPVSAKLSTTNESTR